MADFPLTKCFAREDRHYLAPELEEIKVNYFGPCTWEICLALRAISLWQHGYDGAKPPIERALVWDFDRALGPVLRARGLSYANLSLCERLSLHANVCAPGHVAICLRRLTRIAEPKDYLRRISEHLLPGGLLILTFDIWNCEGEDVAVGHENRKRIYNEKTWKRLRTPCLQGMGFRLFGGADWKYHDDAFEDCSVASLVMIKEVERRSDARNP